MASDTVPAAVPGPADDAAGTPTSNPASEPRGLAGLLSAVDPARPTAGFHIDPTTTTDGTDTAVTGASSAAYHGGENTDQTGSGNTSKNNGSGRQERSVMRAWMLAGAERWKQGGAARIKRLEMEKARHLANQVKETRTVSVNRSGGTGGKGGSGGGKGGSGSGNSNGGKSLNSKTNRSDSATGPKNSAGTSRHGSGAPSGGSGRGGSGGGAGGGKGRNSGGTGGGTSSHHSSGTTKNDKPNRGNKNGSDRQTTTTTCGDGSGIGNKRGKDKAASPKPGTPSGGKDGKAGPSGNAGSSGAHGKDGASTSGGKTPSGAGTGSTKATAASEKPSAKVDLKKKPEAAPGKTDKASASGKTDKGGTADKASTDRSGSKTTDTTKSGTGTAPATGKPRLDTQASRETGYRDGTRAARVVAHVEAYRDGVKDGWTDTKEAAARDKDRLDQAHADRKKDREKDTAVTGASSADYHPTTPEPPAGPQPIPVTGIDATTVHLGPGATRSSMGRGEVRRLKDFERRLDTKTDTMTRIADDTKTLKAHAENQAKQITKLLEQAKGVKGGEKLIAALTRLEEAANVQAGTADEINKRATRGAEACRVVRANAGTRYGAIYQAVVDSDETAPAELAYYQDGAATHA